MLQNLVKKIQKLDNVLFQILVRTQRDIEQGYKWAIIYAVSEVDIRKKPTFSLMILHLKMCPEILSNPFDSFFFYAVSLIQRFWDANQALSSQNVKWFKNVRRTFAVNGTRKDYSIYLYTFYGVIQCVSNMDKKSGMS